VTDREIDELHRVIVADLVDAGAASPYPADANEPDPRYLSYGVRAAGKKQIISRHRPAVRALDTPARLELAERLISSGYGEQQSVGLAILEPLADHFSPEHLGDLDRLLRHLRGWSKVDEFSGSLVRDVLFNHPDELLTYVRQWNAAEDRWLKRLSVVLFTRKVAASGRFTDVALELCDNLAHDEEDLVRKGVGWSLKDLMKLDRERVLAHVAGLRADGVSGVVIRYAIKDLSAEERAAFLAG
jgi:3-methyladenine DNA glycosylase AlkD